MEAKGISEIEKKRAYNSLAISVLLTLFLFYIDEGYYNFRWMLEPGAWFVFVLYSGMFFIGQLASVSLLFPNTQNRLLIATKYVIGIIAIPLVWTIAIMLFKK